jgi:hypothetical protein
VYLHVIGRRFIAKPFVLTFERIIGNAERHDSASPSLKDKARKAHQAKQGFQPALLRACPIPSTNQNEQERITTEITEPE